MRSVKHRNACANDYVCSILIELPILSSRSFLSSTENFNLKICVQELFAEDTHQSDSVHVLEQDSSLHSLMA